MDARFLVEQHIVAFSQNDDHISRIDKADSALYLNGESGKRPPGKLLQPGESLQQAQILFACNSREARVHSETHGNSDNRYMHLGSGGARRRYPLEQI